MKNFVIRIVFLQLQKSEQLTKEDIEVRLQWDPDHTPDGCKEKRRAIQLGLKGKAGVFSYYKLKTHNLVFASRNCYL